MNRKEFLQSCMGAVILAKASGDAPAERAEEPMNEDRKSKVSLRVSTYYWMDERRCAELLELCRAYARTLDEVAFFTSLTHPPLPLPLIEERAGILASIIPRFKEAGLKAGINHLATMGHHDENLDYSLNEPWQRVMDIRGNTIRGCFCPSDDRLMRYNAAAYTALAKAGPDFIWIDDDVRMAGHGPLQHVCFCDLCLAKFARETDTRKWTRESLQEAFNAGPIEDRLLWRRRWLEHNRRMIGDLMAAIRKTVDSTDSRLPLGSMSGEIFYGGCGYGEWAEALKGRQNVPVKWRPGGGFYTDAAPGEMFGKAHSIGRQSEQLPLSVTDIQSEIECFPYQRLKKSATILALEGAAYIAAGCTGAALNLFGIAADPFQEYLPYFEKMESWREFYEKEAQAFGRSRCKGLWPAANRDYFASFNIDGDWLAAPAWATPGEAAEMAEIGLPAAYSQEGAALALLSGDASLSFSHEEILNLLSGGVLADAAALARLNDSGYGEYTGFEIAGAREADTLEILTGDELNGSFSGWHRDCRQSFWPETAFLLNPTAPGARALSEGRDFGGNRLGILSGAFENRAGGRIAICGYYPWRSLQSLSKSSQVKALCRWLSRDTLPAYIDSYHKIVLWSRQDIRGNTALFLLNASLDAAKKIRLHLLSTGERAALVTPDGRTRLLKRSAVQEGYAAYDIPKLEAWEAALLVQI
ncbi:MAG: hypothetical protein IT210_11140 [Armatimonadetes bacterium]|nr:hypothetical protein [Armatimonadota bacterium]